VVSGVGHEVDVTIADFAADLRAPTPSAAAEAVVPDRAEWRRSVAATRQRLARAWQRVGGLARERLAWLARRLELTHPRTRLAARAQRLDELEARLGRALRRELADARARLGAAARTLNAVSPLATLERGYAIVTRADGRVVRAARDVAPGDEVRSRTAAGSFAATVTVVES
jgi:exodeoxyribonuclease VII large subunit